MVSTRARSWGLPSRREAPRAYVERPVPFVLRWPLVGLAAAGHLATAALDALRRRRWAGPPPVVEPDGPDVVVRGTAFPDDERRYLLVPFEVRGRPARLEVDYEWEPLGLLLGDNPLAKTVLDLGVWDEHGYREAAGFRGWSGSRHRRVWIEAGAAQRGYRPGPLGEGTWHAELGIAAVGPTGAGWTLRVRSRSVGREPARVLAPDPVDAAHVARPEPGWYHGDLHMHSWHSHPEAPEPEEFVAFARAAGLDFLPITEYVVGHHWTTAGALQRAHPDLLIWPGREIVTYHGHVQCLGETPGFIEYRHGFEDVDIRAIQAGVRAGGALFGVNHPTTFAGPLFRNLCRGCEFELGEDVDWDGVDTIEVLTGPMMVDPSHYGLGSLGHDVANPFSASAVELWERLLDRGHKICAVSGSDDKRGPGLGTSATAVLARELSRPAIVEGIRAGRAYVRTLGVHGSPTLELTATNPQGEEGTFGAVLPVEPGAAASLAVTVRGGRGQQLRVVRGGERVHAVAIDDDPFTARFAAPRVPAREGPLGTWYRVETADRRCRTTLSNPVFLVGPAGGSRPGPAPPG